MTQYPTDQIVAALQGAAVGRLQPDQADAAILRYLASSYPKLVEDAEKWRQAEKSREYFMASKGWVKP